MPCNSSTNIVHYAFIYKKFFIEIAHQLSFLPDDHPCSRLHGHRLVVSVATKGEVQDSCGWVHDAKEIKIAFQPLYQQLDHHYLNDIEGLSIPTSENLAIWIWNRLIAALPHLYKITIEETETSRIEYYGPQKRNQRSSLI